MEEAERVVESTTNNNGVNEIVEDVNVEDCMVECAADGDGLVEVAEDGGRVDSVVAGISDEDVGIKNV